MRRLSIAGVASVASVACCRSRAAVATVASVACCRSRAAVASPAPRPGSGLARAAARLRAALLASVALVLLAASLASAQSGWQDVWKSESASKRVSLQGQVVTRALFGDHEETATAVVRAANGKLRLDYQAGGRRWSLVDNGRNLIRLLPDKREATIVRRPSFAVDAALAERNYTARITGKAQVAGRTTSVAEVAARPHGPVAWRLWLDRDTGLALKRERYNHDGTRISGTEYTTVDFDARIPPDTFAVPDGWTVTDRDGPETRLTIPELSRKVGFPVIAPRWVPQGYVLMGGYVQTRGEHNVTVAELRYTDGLRLLSVNQRPRGEGDEDRDREHGRGGRRSRGGRGEGGGDHRGGRGGGPRSDRREPMHVADRGAEQALRYRGKTRIIVIVGDLPSDQLAHIANTIDQPD